MPRNMKLKRPQYLAVKRNLEPRPRPSDAGSIRGTKSARAFIP